MRHQATFLAAFVGSLGFAAPSAVCAADNAAFVAQNVPTAMTAGQTSTVTVTMQNTGTTSWAPSRDLGYKLGTQNPQDNTLWTGATRVYMNPGESVIPGQSKVFTFNITAPTTPGTYNFQWRMVHEAVAWFGASSPNVAVNVTAPPVTLCPGVSVTPDGATDLGPAIQACIDRSAAGGTLNLPPGVYGIGTQVLLSKPFTLQTQGLAGSTASCEAAGSGCAVLRALPSFNTNGGGFLAVDSTHEVTLDHLILDGNRQARLGTTAAAQCAAGSNRYGFNARMSDCTFCRVISCVSKNALCGSGLEFRGNDGVITGNVFRANGQNAVNNMWADGLTVHYSDRATIVDNVFVDNSDVALIVGGGCGAVVQNNSISQPGQVVFAGLMLDNFNGTTSGDFTGALVTGNNIDCSAARNCHFGIQLGPHPWYLSTNIVGGEVHGNRVTSARQGINVEGAGTTAAPLLLYGNSVSGSAPSSARFNCGSHRTSDFNINTADSVVDRGGDSTPITTFAWHLCP